jgi:hypothetical protein
MDHPLNKILACVGLACGLGCDSAAESPAPAQAAVDAPDVAAPVTAEERPAPDPGRLERARKRLLETRELASHYAAGTLGDRLAVGKLLLVDARAPADTDQSQFFVFAGEVAAPANFAALAEMTGSDGAPARKHLQGGEDATRVAVYHNIEPGPYTVCVALSGPVDPAQLAYLKKAEAAFEADGGGKLSAEKIEAAAAKAKAETGYTPQKTDWSARPVRCKTVVVTADAASRVVVVE